MIVKKKQGHFFKVIVEWTDFPLFISVKKYCQKYNEMY